MTSGPNNLDPRIGTDDTSQKLHQLIFNNLDGARRAPACRARAGRAARTTRIRLTYVATLRRGVRFHDGHELTSADVVYTFGSFLDPAFVSPRKGALSRAGVGRRRAIGTPSCSR